MTTEEKYFTALMFSVALLLGIAIISKAPMVNVSDTPIIIAWPMIFNQ